MDEFDLERRRDLFLISTSPHRFIALGSAGDKIFNKSILSQLTKLPQASELQDGSMKSNDTNLKRDEQDSSMDGGHGMLGKRIIQSVLDEESGTSRDKGDHDGKGGCGSVCPVPGGSRHSQLTIDDVILVDGEPMMTTCLIHMGFGLSRFQPFGKYVKAYADSKELASLCATAMARARGQWGFEDCEIDEATGALILPGKKKTGTPIPLSHTVTSRGVLYIPDEEIKKLVSMLVWHWLRVASCSLMKSLPPSFASTWTGTA